MKLSGLARPGWTATIRVRLGLALAVALLPVLFLSGLQAALAFQHQEQADRLSLTAAAQRSAATARARIESAEVLLQTLAPGSVGLYQIAIQVPPSLADGDWPIQAVIGGVLSPSGTILSVHQ